MWGSPENDPGHHEESRSDHAQAPENGQITLHPWVVQFIRRESDYSEKRNPIRGKTNQQKGQSHEENYCIE
jgi:hypothetical protein